MPDQSTGTYAIGLLVISTAGVCGLMLWLDRIRAELRRLHRRDLERRLRNYQLHAMDCRMLANDCQTDSGVAQRFRTAATAWDANAQTVREKLRKVPK